jgi:hypothetical protein
MIFSISHISYMKKNSKAAIEKAYTLKKKFLTVAYRAQAVGMQADRPRNDKIKELFGIDVTNSEGFMKFNTLPIRVRLDGSGDKELSIEEFKSKMESLRIFDIHHDEQNPNFLVKFRLSNIATDRAYLDLLEHVLKNVDDSDVLKKLFYDEDEDGSEFMFLYSDLLGGPLNCTAPWEESEGVYEYDEGDEEDEDGEDYNDLFINPDDK